MSQTSIETPENLTVAPPVSTQIDYKAELEKLGIQETQITPELLSRFQEALRRYQSGANANLALLEERVYSNLDEEAASTEEKISALTTWIVEQEAINGDISTDTIAGVEASVAEATETLEAMRTRLASEASSQAESAIQAKLGNIPLFGEAIAGWLVEQGKSYIDASNNSGVGGKIKLLFIGLIAGMFGVQGVFNELKNKVEAAKNAQLPEIVVRNIPEVNPITPVEEEIASVVPVIPIIPEVSTLEEQVEETLPEREISLETRKNAYSTAGNMFFAGLASAHFEEGHTPQGVYAILNNISWGRMQEIYREYLEVPDESSEKEQAYVSMLQKLGIENQTLINDKVTTLGAIESIVHPDTISIVRGRLTEEVRNFLRNDEKLQEQFGPWLQEVLRKNPEEMTFEELKIILMMSLPSFIIHGGVEGVSLLSEMFFGSQIKEDLELLGADLQERSTSLLPEKVVGIFLAGSLRDNTNIVKDNILLHQTIEGSHIELNEEEQTGLEKLVDFKGSVIESLSHSKFNAGFSNFGDTLKNNLTYTEVILLYNILDGNPDISAIPIEDELLSSTVYSWIILSLPEFSNDTSITRGQYSGAILQSTTTNTPLLTETQVSILLRQSSRTGNAFMREYFSFIQTQRDTFREFSKREVADALGIPEESINDTTLDYMEYAIIVSLLGGSVAAGKLKLPLPLKFAISGFMAGTGANWLLSILYEKGTFGKILQAFEGSDVLSRLDTLIQENTGYSISQLDEKHRAGEDFPAY